MTGAKSTATKSSKKRKRRTMRIVRTVLVGFAATLALLLVLVLGVVVIMLKGPSEEATRLFVLSCNETSAMKWVPGLLLSDAECNAILHPDTAGTSDGSFTPLPVLAAGATQVSLETAETDENTPDIEIIELTGSTYKGKAMLVHDPSRVQVASIDSFGGTGKTMAQFLETYDAIGGSNAGGFEDENGQGKGGTPDGIVIKNGQITYGNAGTSYVGVVGFDADHVLHVGNMTGQQALDLGLVSATSFEHGPVLIKDGVRQTGFVSGINPRTCIGQTADGTVILVAVEGRMADSLGATFDDLCDIMEEYGAVNACNLDGGSSSGLYYEGERITRSSSVVGERPLPTAILVSR